MQTLLIVTFDYRPQLGGVATCTFQLARHLSSHCSVIVLAPESENSKEFDDKQNFKTIRVKSSKKSFLAISNFAKKIIEICKTENPSAILSTTWNPSAVACWISKPFHKTPYFNLTHGVEVIESNRNWRKRLRKSFSFIKKRVYLAASRHFTVSQFTAELVHNFCCIPKGRISVIHNGVDSIEFYPKPKSSKLIAKHNLHEKVVLLTISRLVPHKGIDKTIEALVNLVHKYPHLHYLIGGVGPDESRLKTLISELHLQDHVSFVGKVLFEELNDYYNLCDLYIMISREDFKQPAVEGFGISFLEAGACEKPVLAGDSGGVSDAVIDQVTGHLVNPTDSEKVSDGIELFLKNEDSFKQLGKNARKRILNELNWNISAKKMFQQMEQTLSK